MRPETSMTLMAIIGGTAACMHGDALPRYVSAMSKRQTQQKNVNIYFGKIENVGAEIFGCYAGGSNDADKIPQGIEPKPVDLNGEKFDSNLDLGVMVYYVKASQNSVFMFDTSTAKVLADSCNKGLQLQTNFTIDKVILSHEHQDHVAGIDATSLKNVPVVAQDTLVAKFRANGCGNVPLKQGESQTFQMQDGVMNVTNVQSHTALGTIAMINRVALMGDELESTLYFLVTDKLQGPSTRLQDSEGILRQNNIEKVLPAHGSGAAMFGGQFTLQLLQSNRQYLQLIASDPQSVCGNEDKGQTKAQLAEKIGMEANNITDAYFKTHLNSNCKKVGGKAQGAQKV